MRHNRQYDDTFCFYLIYMAKVNLSLFEVIFLQHM